MMQLLSWKQQYKGKRTKPSVEELTAIIEAIKVEHDTLEVDHGGYAKPICVEAFRDVLYQGSKVPTAVSVSYESRNCYFNDLEISKTEDGKFYVTVTDSPGDTDEESYAMMDTIKDFEDIEL